MESKIKEVLKNKVNPILASHDGKVEFIKVEGDTVIVKFDGACAGCPSAAVTLEEIVATAIMEEVSEIKNVKLSQGVSDDLINFAKKLLNHEK